MNTKTLRRISIIVTVMNIAICAGASFVAATNGNALAANGYFCAVLGWSCYLMRLV